MIDMTHNHLRYVLHNVMCWNRGWHFDRRSLKQIAKACAKYDDSWSWREYHAELKAYRWQLFTRATSNSIYRLREEW